MRNTVCKGVYLTGVFSFSVVFGFKVSVVEDNAPRVYDNAACNPLSVLIEEECKVILILTVKILLVAHSPIVVSLHQKSIILKRNRQNPLVILSPSDVSPVYSNDWLWLKNDDLWAVFLIRKQSMTHVHMDIRFLRINLT